MTDLAAACICILLLAIVAALWTIAGSVAKIAQKADEKRRWTDERHPNRAPAPAEPTEMK